MKMLVVFVILLHVSQHALAVVVEVNEGERAVLLLCLYSGFIPEDNPTVMWTRSDLDPKSVHLRGEGGDDLEGQNQHYDRRTSMSPYALITKDFSLTLRKPKLTDSGNYTCSISNGQQERRLRDIQLQVKDQQVEVKVEEGSESVILPCRTTPDPPEDTRVEWTRSDLGVLVVHEYSSKSGQFMTQDDFYRERTKVNEDLLRIGDLSLTLKQPTGKDTGRYICTIYRDKDILRQKVVLQVKEPFPFWAKALLVLLVFLVVSGGLLFYFRHYFMSVYQKEVNLGVESVQLLCKAAVHLPKDAKVEWRDSDDRKVHVYQNGSDQPEEQDQLYRDRTEMKRNLLKPGDLSLTLKQPTERDTNTYTCTINMEGNVLVKKQVLLTVKVPQVEEVGSGVESVQLNCKTTVCLPEDAKVEWKNSYNRQIHMYQNGSDQSEEQNWFYRERTKMNEDLLKTGDLSLTLKYPTDWDRDTYTCTVYSSEGNILMKKTVELKIRVCQVEVEEGAESVQLPFKTTENLPKDVKVEWWDSDDRKIHVYQSGSDQLDKQDQDYRGRTKMNEDLLRTGDLSLTLDQPTERDSGEYRCKVYGKIRRYQKVLLKVKVPQVKMEVESGVESVQLPCKAAVHLLKDAKVEWRNSSNRQIHVYQKCSDQFEEQDHRYRRRTKMKEDLLRTGDLSLTLKQPTNQDTDTYTCTIYSRAGNILMRKKVMLKVTVPQVEVEVDAGMEYVQLPFTTTLHLPEDAKVEWTDTYGNVCVYQNGLDWPDGKNHCYSRRTKMNEDLLKTGDLSLTLDQPTERETDTYTCTIYSREGNILMKKRVMLKVRVPQVEVDSGVESVQLPCKATVPLPEDAKVEWTDSSFNMKVHVYENGSDQSEEQRQVYRDRTEMNEDLLRTGDLSLTVKYPTERDTDTYTCTLYSREGDILMKKRVMLKVKVCQVEVEEGAESVWLPFKTTENLPGDLKLQWMVNGDRMVHIFQNSSHQPKNQDEFYRGRTKMNEDLLKTGDLSLTLDQPTERDSGEYSCGVNSSQIFRHKKVLLKVKGTNQKMDSGSYCTEMTPLMADQSV